MKRKWVIFWIIIAIIVIISIWSFIQRRNSNPKIHYRNKKMSSGKQVVGITLPPIGIFVNKNTPVTYETPDGVHSVEKHEKVHWKQYQDQGLLGFYLGYLWGWATHGYKMNPYEVQARELAGEPVAKLPQSELSNTGENLIF